ncbi:MAG: hypothetical protein AB7E47_04420 [Desulfovibrionaceae bacterium]
MKRLFRLFRLPGNAALTDGRLFLIGLVVFACAQGWFINAPLFLRQLPPEPDDAHIYTVKAQQMETCFFQHCTGLDDLRAQFGQADAVAPTWNTAKARITAFTIYHPLHSAVLALVHTLGFGWETAYKIVWALGSLLFITGAALLLRALFGAGPAGVGLLLLAVQTYANQGMHYVVPSNLTLAMALPLWASLIRNNGVAPKALVAGSAAMLAMHPAGRIYALVAAGLAWLLDTERRLSTKIAAAATVALVGLAFLLPALVTSLELSRPFEPAPEHFSALRFLHATVKEIVGNFYRFAHATGGVPGAVLLLATGCFALNERMRRVLLRLCGLLGLFLAASLFHVQPHYPADVFNRLWIALAIPLTGVCGLGLYHMCRTGRSLVRHGLGPDNLPIPLPKRVSSKTLGWVVLALAAGILFQSLQNGGERMASTMDKVVRRYNYTYNLKQPALLRDVAASDDRVLYTDLFPMAFYLAHGRYDLGMVYYPSVTGTPEEAAWLDPARLHFAVLRGPLMAYESRHGTRFPLNEFNVARLTGGSGPGPRTARLRIENRGGDATLRLSARAPGELPGSAGMAEQAIEAGFDGWVDLPLVGLENSRDLEISLTAPGRGLSLLGVNVDNGETFWPWNRFATVTLTADRALAQAVSLDMDLTRYMPEPVRTRPATVLDDAGVFMLVRFDDHAAN